MRRLETALSWVPGLAFIAAGLAILQYVVEAGYVRRALMPTPVDIGTTLWNLLASGSFVAPLLSTLGLFAIGFCMSVVLGILIGLMMGVSQTWFNLLEPLLEGVRPMPKVALIPVLMLFLGIDNTMKVTAIVLSTFFPVLINTIQGVRGVDPVLIATGRTFGMSRLAMLRKIIFPAAFPYILAGMRIAVAIALLVTILAEMLAGTVGLGYVIMENQRSFMIREMYSWLVILAVLGLVLNSAMNLAERRLAPWLEKHRRA